MKNWYIVQSHSNFENKVAELIKEEAEKAKISDKIDEIIVPTHDVTEVKRGKRVKRKKKYFPGYVLMKSEMNNNIYHMIKNIKKVSGFLGTKGIPVPVSDIEIDKILGQIKDGVTPRNIDMLQGITDNKTIKQLSPLEILHEKLAKAVEEERYEDAARFRDEIDKLKKHTDN